MRQDSNASTLSGRIAAFKSDPEKFRQANEFVEELIQQALRDAEAKQKEKYRDKFDSDSTAEVGNLKQRLGRARGFVIRMFDALCNCTQTAAAAARTTAARNNLFTKR